MNAVDRNNILGMLSDPMVCATIQYPPMTMRQKDVLRAHYG